MMFHRLHIGLVIAFSALLGVSACGDSSVASMNSDIKGGCWNMIDTLDLTFENTDTSKVYRVQFPLTFTDAYSYRNIYLRILVQPPSGPAGGEAFNFDIQDEYGEWYGDFDGESATYDLELPDPFRMNQLGTYRFRLVHFMRDVSLCGITGAGIRLLPASGE